MKCNLYHRGQLIQLTMLTSRILFVLFNLIVFVLIVRSPLRHYSSLSLRPVSGWLSVKIGENKANFLKFKIRQALSLFSNRTLYPLPLQPRMYASSQCATIWVTAPIAYQRRLLNDKNQWRDQGGVTGWSMHEEVNKCFGDPRKQTV